MPGCPLGFDRASVAAVQRSPTSSSPPPRTLSAEELREYVKQLQECRKELRAFINENNCNPIMVRLAWHDSGTFDVQRAAANDAQWPQAGGANGSIRLSEELKHGANAGLSKAVLYLKEFKEKFSALSWADLMQMASAEAIALAGGPVIQMRYGREDADSCPVEGNLPDALPPFKGESTGAQHLRNVFYRMGFGDRDIVALSGAHTLGRAFKERSGTVENGYLKDGTAFTSDKNHVARPDGQKGLGMMGGRSWTKNWLSFDNSYFTQGRGDDTPLTWLPTDEALRTDPAFRPHFDRYASSQEEFFRDYAEAHRKLSELGSRFVVPGGIALPATATSKL